MGNFLIGSGVGFILAILLVVISDTLVNVDNKGLEYAIKVCANNNGVEKLAIGIDTLIVICKNGAEFRNYDD